MSKKKLPRGVNAAVLPYLETLRRIPDHAILDMATREFGMLRTTTCLCGWALREALCNGVPAESIPDDDLCYPETRCAQYYGGDVLEWSRIFWGAAGREPVELEPDRTRPPLIEEAFTLRVMEAAGVA